MSSYQHCFVGGKRAALPVGKVVCVGRNYADHARELNNPIPSQPLLFIKPATSMAAFNSAICLPDYGGQCHFETELSILIGEQISAECVNDLGAKIAGYGLGLDLTLRELQDSLKSKGHPWEMAKAFDGACPLSEFVPAEDIEHPEYLGLCAKVNGEFRQQGFAEEMLSPVFELLAYISQYFTLCAGDVVLTGTPAGVGPLYSGDKLALSLLLNNGDGKIKTLAEYACAVAE